MAIRRDLSDLPTAAARPARPPAKTSVVVEQIADAWYQQWLTSGDAEYLPAVAGRWYRASFAGQRCDRQQYYALAGEERSNPTSIAGIWRMKLGNLVHDELGNVIEQLGDGWRTEVIVDLEPIGVDGSAHADMARFVCVHCGAPILMEDAPDNVVGTTEIVCYCSDLCADHDVFEIVRTAKHEHTWSPAHERAADVVEFKTMGGYGFKMAVTTQGGPPEGAKFGHIIQGAICADGLGCDRLTVAYMGMEPVSPKLAQAYAVNETQRFAAEWHFSVSTLRPYLDREYARIRQLQQRVMAKRIPLAELHEPEIPVGAHIVDPMRQRWEVADADGRIAQTGQHPWICDYCDWRDRCVADGPDAAPADEVSI